MSRSYRVLVVALVGVAVLFGLSKAIGHSSSGSSTTAAAASGAATTSTAASATSTTPGSTTGSTTGGTDAASPSSTAAAPAADSTTSTAAAAPATDGITDADCPSSAHGAVIDRNTQRAALCDHGTVAYRFPITSARRQPDPGTYPVYARDMHTSSMFGGHYSTMTHFVAFTHGKYTRARIAFHSVPVLSDGSYVQPLSSVGSPEQWGNTSGCIHVIPTDAVKVWNWLALGDEVHVIS